MIYDLYEIGYDHSLEVNETLIENAQYHCEQYPERTKYLPITTVEQAIKYWTNFGFEVKPLREGSIVRVSTATDDDELNEFLDEHGDEIIINEVDELDDYFWGKTTTGVDVPYHMEGRDIREVIKL